MRETFLPQKKMEMTPAAGPIGKRRAVWNTLNSVSYVRTCRIRRAQMKKLIVALLLLINIIPCNASVKQPISFLQYDEEWGQELYTAYNDTSQTIAASGCGPTAASMVINYYIDDETNPLDLSSFALERNHRTRNDGTAWSMFADLAEVYRLEFLQTSSAKEAKEWMETKEDALVICSMNRGLWTSEGHFILVWKIENDRVYINDPASTSLYRLENNFSILSSQCGQYFCFNQMPQKTILLQSFNNFYNSQDMMFFSIVQNTCFINKDSWKAVEKQKFHEQQMCGWVT